MMPNAMFKLYGFITEQAKLPSRKYKKQEPVFCSLTSLRWNQHGTSHLQDEWSTFDGQCDVVKHLPCWTAARRGNATYHLWALQILQVMVYWVYRAHICSSQQPFCVALQACRPHSIAFQRLNPVDTPCPHTTATIIITQLIRMLSYCHLWHCVSTGQEWQLHCCRGGRLTVVLLISSNLKWHGPLQTGWCFTSAHKDACMLSTCWSS
jgi:hypothetical protein